MVRSQIGRDHLRCLKVGPLVYADERALEYYLAQRQLFFEILQGFVEDRVFILKVVSVSKLRYIFDCFHYSFFVVLLKRFFNLIFIRSCLVLLLFD